MILQETSALALRTAQSGKYHSIATIPISMPPGSGLPLLVLRDGSISKSALHFAHRSVVNLGRSPSWVLSAIRAVGFLYDYHESLHQQPSLHGGQDVSDLLHDFALARLYGTIGPDGTDLSALRWSSRSWESARMELRYVTQYCQHCAAYLDHNTDVGIAIRFTDAVRDAYARETRKNFSFFVHLEKAREHYESLRNQPTPRLPGGPRQSAQHGNRAISFPPNQLLRLVFDGTRRVPADQAARIPYHEAYNIRDQLAYLLLAYGGLRTSELFHIFVDDIHREKDGTARVFLFHPDDGLCRLKDARGAWRQCDRKAYLLSQYGLTPRHRLPKAHPMHAGWKSLLLEKGAPHNYALVHWIDPGMGRLFWELHQIYIRHVRPLTPTHPYYFVSLDPTRYGEPLRVKNFQKQFKRSCKRIGVREGLTNGGNPHGLRHFYGFLAVKLKIPPQHIQIMLHHVSPLSQRVYTRPPESAVNEAIAEAYSKLQQNPNLSAQLSLSDAKWRSDPMGLFESWSR